MKFSRNSNKLNEGLITLTPKQRAIAIDILAWDFADEITGDLQITNDLKYHDGVDVEYFPYVVLLDGEFYDAVNDSFIKKVFNKTPKELFKD